MAVPRRARTIGDFVPLSLRGRRDCRVCQAAPQPAGSGLLRSRSCVKDPGGATLWAGHEHQPWQNRDMTNNVLRNAKAKIKKAKLDLSAPFTLHTFRKSFAQNHADAGTPPKTLARLLGHSDVTVTMEFYNRVSDANERQAASTVDKMFASGAARKASGSA